MVPNCKFSMAYLTSRATMDQTKFTRAFNDIFHRMKEKMGGNSTVKQNLTEFSLWLSNFEQSEFLEYIELPGMLNEDGAYHDQDSIRASQNPTQTITSRFPRSMVVYWLWVP